MTFMRGEYWEADLVVPGVKDKVGLVVPAGETGPSDAQALFCGALLSDLDGLFSRCRPVFEGDFEEWTERPFPGDWREEFALVGIGLPEDGEESKPWDVTYFVDSANHYFTAYFEEGRPSYLTVDG